MKTATLKQSGQVLRAWFRSARWLGAGLLVGLAGVANLPAATVTTLAGFDAGYADGNSAATALFNRPAGIALNTTNNLVFVADQNNNVIRQLDLGSGLTSTFLTSKISQPVGVALDATNNIYVLNRGNGNNGNIIWFNRFANFKGTNATQLTNATAMALDNANNIYVTVQSNRVIKVTPNGAVSTVVVITNAIISTNFTTLTNKSVLLQGIVVLDSGLLAVTDSKNNGIWLVNPVTMTYSQFTGFNGAGDTLGDSADAQFNQPYGIAKAGNNILVVTDYGNNRVRYIDPDGTVEHLYGVPTADWFPGEATPGWFDGDACDNNSGSCAEARNPYGVVVAQNGDVFTTEIYYDIIRQITGTGFTPTIPPTPAPAPEIGWVDFQPPSLPVSILRPGTSFVFNNDETIAILGTNDSQVYYTIDGSDPSAVNGATAPFYQDGLLPSEVPASIIAPQPDVTIKAVGVNPGNLNSPIVQTRIQFVTANPLVSGNNAAQFTVTDITTGAQMWYTIDGSNPTNAAPSLGPIASGTTLSLNVISNLTFKVVAFRNGYQPSAILPTVFTVANFSANSISFGFASGEASSAFLASPGQFFYAPVTLSVLPSTVMDSLQFEMSVTNLVNLPGTNSPPVGLGQISFQSMLVQPDPSNATIYFPIPPAMTVTNALQTGFYSDPPPGNLLFTNNGVVFVSTAVTNSTDNQLDVGWLERSGQSYLFDTGSQDLIQFSQAHDKVFQQSQGGQVVVGGFGFRVPTNAALGSTYVIQLSRPSATTDGIGDNGSAVYISTPTNGSLAAGAVNSIKYVTIGPTNYIAGDSAPFRWFNTGDFGNRLIDGSDVAQVFEAAIYALNAPPPGSDFFDSMDSCCRPAITNVNGYLLPAPPGSFNTNALYLGDDSSIDLYPFGDGKLDVTDVYVTFRRSFSGPMWFERFWTANGLAATNVPNVYNSSGGASDNQGSFYVLSASNPAVAFYAGDAQGSAGQTVQIPVTARTEGSYPLRVLMFNLTVDPLEGSPPITTAVQFTPDAALGASSIPPVSSGPNNYAAAWLNSDTPGLSTNATLGTLTITLPAGAGPLSSYAIHFDHASGSPNGMASFPVTANTGVITLSARTSSHFNDGIPDIWRLRHFGTVSNVLSMASADADADGANNWNEYQAGTDPNDAQSVLKAAVGKGTNAPECVIHWPTAVGINYVIQKSTSLYGTNWTTVTTNAGTGWDLEFHDTTPGTGPRFYRVQAAP